MLKPALSCPPHPPEGDHMPRSPPQSSTSRHCGKCGSGISSDMSVWDVTPLMALPKMLSCGKGPKPEVPALGQTGD